MQRINRTRRLTPEEAAKYNTIRAQAEKDFPPLNVTHKHLPIARAIEEWAKGKGEDWRIVGCILLCECPDDDVDFHMAMPKAEQVETANGPYIFWIDSSMGTGG